MNTGEKQQENFKKLEDALRRRVEVIADHELRDRDAEAHLAALKDVSLEIRALQESLGQTLPPRLRHFLENASYAKALDFLTTS